MGLFQPALKENTQREVSFRLNALPSLARKTLVRFLGMYVHVAFRTHVCESACDL